MCLCGCVGTRVCLAPLSSFTQISRSHAFYTEGKMITRTRSLCIFSRMLGLAGLSKNHVSANAVRWRGKVTNEIKERWRRWSRKRDRGGWRRELQCYFSPFPLQPYQSLMLWDNSWTPKPCYIPFTLSSHLSGAKHFFFSFLYLWTVFTCVCTFLMHRITLLTICLTFLFWTPLLSQPVSFISLSVCVYFMDAVAKMKLK